MWNFYRAAAALMMGDDMHKLSRSRFERGDFGLNGGVGITNPGSRQIYLTFPADSTFKEEDVSNYFRYYWFEKNNVLKLFPSFWSFGFFNLVILDFVALMGLFKMWGFHIRKRGCLVLLHLFIRRLWRPFLPKEILILYVMLGCLASLTKRRAKSQRSLGINPFYHNYLLIMKFIFFILINLMLGLKLQEATPTATAGSNTNSRKQHQQHIDIWCLFCCR